MPVKDHSLPASTIKPKVPKRNQFVVKQGALPPAAQVMHFSPQQWEEFVERACLHRPLNASAMYVQVKRLGGSGDAGRDIEARLVPKLKPDGWDLYQAKHYDHRLAPTDVFTELAKFFTHLTAGTYPNPRHYYLCSPHNAGPMLHDLIAQPEKLKESLLADWVAGNRGLKAQIDDLTPQVRAVVMAFDFSRIRECLVRDLLAWHAADQKAHFQLFGIESERGTDPTVPMEPSAQEDEYVQELIRVYSEHGAKLMTRAEVENEQAYSEHFQSQRAAFYCAEGLKRFSRDLYTEDEFGSLLSMVLSGIGPIVHSPKHKAGMDRLDVALGTVSNLKLSDSKLATRMRGGDLPGTCHHLVNEKRLKWVK